MQPQSPSIDSSQSDLSALSWWIEISTSVPRCVSYFGPFDSRSEAQLARTSYVNDLYQKEARDIVALVKQCQPDVLILRQDKGTQCHLNPRI